MNGSRLGKWVRRAAAILLLGLVLGGAALYLLASWLPSDYHPAALPFEERTIAAQKFIRKMVDLTNDWQRGGPFALSFTEAELNACLASMDEIAAFDPNGSPGDVHRLMDRAGLAGPAAAVHDGVLTLMVRLKDYGKVISADLSFEFLPTGNLRVHLEAVRVGRLPVPAWLYRSRLGELRQALASRAGRKPASPGSEGHPRAGVSVEDVSTVLSRVIAAIDEEPVPAYLPARIRGRVARVDRIDLRNQALTIHFQPVAAAALDRPR